MKTVVSALAFAMVLTASAAIVGRTKAAGSGEAGVPEDPAARTNHMPVDRVVATIDWLASGHPYGDACIRIGGDEVIYIDPASLADRDTSVPADLVLVTHGHDDHCSPATLAKIRQPSTRILTTAACARELPADWRPTVVVPGERLTVNGVRIEAVPAYSVSSRAHPREAGGVGYVVTLGGVRVYHTGDTSLTPEMAAVGHADILVADLRAPFQMSGDEILEAARILKPSYVIPVHWLTAERSDAEQIASRAPAGTKVLLRSQVRSGRSRGQ